MLRRPDRPSVGVIFTDIQLGGALSGWDVADAFQESYPEIQIVYTSGNIQDLRRQVPGSTFLAKPYLPTDVLDAIESSAAQR